MPRTVAAKPVLSALLDGRMAGSVYRLAGGRLRFVYDHRWRLDPEAYPVSWSMPLSAAEHEHDSINAYLWGLLPDNQRTLDGYARRFNVSARSPVDLLAHTGADCAGAIQLVPPGSVAQYLGAPPSRPLVQWLSETEVAAELRAARESGISGGAPGSMGQFSLAGTQPKLALLEANGRWGRPYGRTPTNRILKPPTGEHAGFAENEHFCLDLAARLGLVAMRSRVMHFDDEITIVVDRFDRRSTAHQPARVHQEDVCQALAVMPHVKYEIQGGPGIADIVRLLREASSNSETDIRQLLGMVAFNWIIAATDAHAKNFALLHAPGPELRLAPFYDLISYLPYDTSGALRQVKMAMRIGGEYRARQVTRTRWRKLAEEARVDAGQLLDQMADLLASFPDAVEQTRAAAVHSGLNATHVNGLAALIQQRAQELAKAGRPAN